MNNQNFNELKRLFDELSNTHSPSTIFATLLNGRPIYKAKRSLIKAIRLIEEGCVNIPSTHYANQAGKRFADRLCEIGENLDRPMSEEISPSTNPE